MPTLKKRIEDLEGRGEDNEDCRIFIGRAPTRQELEAPGAKVVSYVPNEGRNPEVIAREKQQIQDEISRRMVQQRNNQE
jgi:hypothetical protein